MLDVHKPMTKRGIFLDRDDTLTVNIPYLGDPDQITLLPGVYHAVHWLLRAGYLLYLFTNQSGINRGMISPEAVSACNQRTAELLDLNEGFQRVCVAPERPDEAPVYRKPQPRFILECLKADDLNPDLCWMVGDKPSDVEAGQRAGIHSARVGCNVNAPERGEFIDLSAFVDWLLD